MNSIKGGVSTFFTPSRILCRADLMIQGRGCSYTGDGSNDIDKVPVSREVIYNWNNPSVNGMNDYRRKFPKTALGNIHAPGICIYRGSSSPNLNQVRTQTGKVVVCIYMCIYIFIDLKMKEEEGIDKFWIVYIHSIRCSSQSHTC
jgi:hypothetical protein